MKAADGEEGHARRQTFKAQLEAHDAKDKTAHVPVDTMLPLYQ